MSVGMLAKLMIGAVALAAVGAATIPLTQMTDGPGQSLERVVAVSPDATSTTGTSVLEAQPAEVGAFVDDVQAWSDCIKAAVQAHKADPKSSKTGLDPHGSCGESPKYVGRSGELPQQASDKAQENRAKKLDSEDIGNSAGNGPPEDKADNGKSGEKPGKGKSGD